MGASCLFKCLFRDATSADLRIRQSYSTRLSRLAPSQEPHQDRGSPLGGARSNFDQKFRRQVLIGPYIVTLSVTNIV